MGENGRETSLFSASSLPLLCLFSASSLPPYCSLMVPSPLSFFCLGSPSVVPTAAPFVEPRTSPCARDCGTAKCVVEEGKAQCKCPLGLVFNEAEKTYSDVSYTVAADPCKTGTLKCARNSKCVVKNGQGSCKCDAGYTKRSGLCTGELTKGSDSTTGDPRGQEVKVKRSRLHQEERPLHWSGELTKGSDSASGDPRGLVVKRSSGQEV
ncbi:unnamed protein product [Closterium sp. NIES-64]|nr:unnamed protein product [Closterium sp. NIES-64]